MFNRKCSKKSVTGVLAAAATVALVAWAGLAPSGRAWGDPPQEERARAELEAEQALADALADAAAPGAGHGAEAVPGTAGGDEALPAGGGAVEHPAAAVKVDPDWMDSLEPGEICGTYQRYLATLAGQGMSPLDGLCPEDGPCDNPIDRDASIPTPETPIKTYRLSIHVFCENDGTNCAATLTDVEGAVAVLNTRYDPWRIQFIYEVDFINSTKYRTLSYREARRMKDTYADSPTTKLNVYVVDTGGVSWGTFPWDYYALASGGGIVIHERWFTLDSPLPALLTHEVGHCLGLWHTFHGVDEVLQCGDCYELAGRSREQGDVTGDRCADTEPTPSNYYCADPGGTDPCNEIAWGVTPYTNIMGYAQQGCQDDFTEQQAGRMHCWTSDILTGWLAGPAGPGITVTPTAGLVTTEADGTDSFTVVLNTEPTADVTIDVSSSDTSEGTVLPPSLSFDATNWDVPQEVTVTGVDDSVVDGDIAYTIITAPAVSADAEYDGLDADDVSVTNLDDEAPPGVSVLSIDPDSMARDTTEFVTITGSGFQSGATVTFENGGGRAPTADVTSVNDTTIEAAVSVHKKAKLLVWDVRVTNPDSSSGVLVDGFTVTP